MRFATEILPAAISDIIEAAKWYEEKREGLGVEFSAAVDAAIDHLEVNAPIGRVRYVRKEVRWIYPRRFPYRICYYLSGRTVKIFAVIHAARHHREWKKRL